MNDNSKYNVEVAEALAHEALVSINFFNFLFIVFPNICVN